MPSYKEIAYQDYVVKKENLPFPIVNYPGFYGTFFAFQKEENTPLYFCKCSKLAIENYLEHSFNINSKAKTEDRLVLDSMNFPQRVINDLLTEENATNISLPKHLLFKESLCHECNMRVPSYRYCHEMYGAIFKQTFGWYINKQAFEYGILPTGEVVLPDKCPKYILETIKITEEEFQEFWAKNLDVVRSKETDDFYNRYHKQLKETLKQIENEVRVKFGHNKVGKNSRCSELILFQIVKSIFPSYKIFRNYRPKFLEGLELDIFISDVNIGIEYQGAQHYEPIKHWGGDKGLVDLQSRDEQKKVFCKKNNISLFYFDYEDGLNEEIVRDRLNIK